MKDGSIICLTRRRGKWYNPRVIISYLIAKLSVSNNNNVDTVITHTAIIYSNNNIFHVRDMDNKGNTSYILEDYLKEYKNRITIKINPNIPLECRRKKFNIKCNNYDVKYDFLNLLVFQIIKVIFGKFIGLNSIKHRICSEDTARMFNILKYKFTHPEEITPSQIYEFTKNWEEIKC